MAGQGDTLYSYSETFSYYYTESSSTRLIKCSCCKIIARVLILRIAILA